MTQNMAQQLELDFSIAASPPLTCSIDSNLDTANCVYIGSPSNITANNKYFSTNHQVKNDNINITCDDIFFTKNDQTKSLFEMISKIEERLSILVPDPAKLKQFKALKQAYENYKTLEAICFTNNE